MTRHRALLTPVALSALLALAGAPAGAQEAASLGTDASLSIDASLSTVESFETSTALARSSAVAVPIRGIVSGKPESVAFSGRAHITSRLVKDPDFGRPALLVKFDLSSVAGVGSSTSASYVIQGEDRMQRRLAASHQFEVTFPFMQSSSTNLLSARSGVAYFAVDFDVDTGAVTNARARIDSPNF
jgi:hypothetical protein